MLNMLKADIARESRSTSFNDQVLEAVCSRDIRSCFIDEEEINENDPNIEKLIEDLPESDEDISEEDLERLTESLL